MLFVKKIAALLTLLSIVSGCRKDAPEPQVPEQQSLTVLFSPGTSFSGAGYDDAILKAVVESMANHPQVNHTLLRPETLDQARSLAQQWQESAGERSMLLLCGVQYEALAPSLSPDKGRVLLLDSRQTLENGVATVQLKRYGGAYLAGALCGGFPNVYIIKALDGDRMMDTVADGIQAGFEDTANVEAQKLVLSDSYKGTNMPDELFTRLVVGFKDDDEFSQDGESVLAPVCGASRMGAYMFSNNYFFFSIGVGEDCSPFSDILPFSLVYDLGGIVKDYIGRWLEGEPWPAHQDFGLSSGHVYIRYNPRYFAIIHKRRFNWMSRSSCLFTQEQYMDWEARYKPIALEQEASHAY